jgi:pimeloyl-ACP methyl ester carboxylesterase
VKRLLLVAVLLLAGCGGDSRSSGPPPPALAKRCGPVHGDWRTLWFDAADGTRLDGAELGSGPRGVLLLHESPSDLCGAEPYGAEIAKRGFHVLIIDLRAFGLSHRGPYGGLRGAVADVRGAVRELKHLGAERVAVVGASYGGATALATAPALGSEIAGVVSLSGELDIPNAQLHALAAVPNITVPLLIMGSRKDHYLDEEDARTMLRNAINSRAQLVEFDGSDHGWNLLAFSHKQRAYQVLIAYLRSMTQ